jgi:ammonia channel protein AmtB
MISIAANIFIYGVLASIVIMWFLFIYSLIYGKKERKTFNDHEFTNTARFEDAKVKRTSTENDETNKIWGE